jgi:hypothetical protein
MAGYIGSKAVNLSTTGADINGDANIDGNLSFRDNDKVIFGAGSDLQIYHDGANSYITEGGVGDLRLGAANIRIGDNTSGASYIYATQNAEVTLYHNNSPKLATTSTGVDITGTLTSDGLTVDGTATIRDDAATTSYYSTDVASNVVTHTSNGTGAFAQEVWKLNDGGTPSERMRLTTTGLGIGTSSPSVPLHIDMGADNNALYIQSSDQFANIGLIDGIGSGKIIMDSGALTFTTGGNATTSFTGSAERMRIDSSGNVGIGTSSPARPFSVTDTTGDGTGGMILASYLPTLEMDDISGGGTSFILQHDTTNTIFKHDTTERMRLDASGNLLVGKTSASTSTVGVEALSNGEMNATVNGGRVISLDRLGSDGDIIRLRKSSTTVGMIGSIGGVLSYIVLDPRTNGIGIRGTNSKAILATGNTGSAVDNYADLGAPAFRFDDIYATNDAIQTSDRNEKQDIEELSDAEQRVAVAAKGLLRKFRWKDAVAEKGDEARTHFGIIAQDLQAAFAAEGLDAGDYAMFISSTWTDEETGEERTRMGVRYSELLAFIIGAL